MSKKRAVDAINLLNTDRIPCQELLDHPALFKKLSGLDPFDNPQQAFTKTIKALDIDLVFGVPEKAVKFNGNESVITTEEGKFTEWGITGSKWEEKSTFSNEEEVLKYDPNCDDSGRVSIVTKEYRESPINSCRVDQELLKDSALVTSLYYTSLFQCFIMAFGWELFLATAALYPDRFKNTIELFTLFSVENTKKWAELDSPVFIFHDDLAITRGLLFPRQWYQENIFPNYLRILEPVRKANKRIIFVSDGRYEELIDDLFELGIDGVIIDTYNNLEKVLEKYGGSKVVIGNMDTRIITSGDKNDIYNEVKRCSDIGKKYAGYFFKASGDLPHNIPLDNLEYYFEYCHKLGRR